MTRVIIREDCGNSPKNNLLQKFTISLAKRDARSILDSVTNDIKWNIVGSQTIEGRESLAGFLDRLKSSPVASLTIQHAASHGKAETVDVNQRLKNGALLTFCNFYEFGNTKGTMLSEITSYVITTK